MSVGIWQGQGSRTNRRLVADRRIAREIAAEAYIYLYPLVLMDVTRRQMTNVEVPNERPGRAPMNCFAHIRRFPSADFHDVTRANFDTLYSFAWIDVANEPVVISVPDAGDRYYLLPLYDMWSDVFASPGTRTTGNGAGNFAVANRDWDLELPPGMKCIPAPTPYVWLIGRTQCEGPADYGHANRFQDRLRLAPLSHWDRKFPAPTGRKDARLPERVPPPKQVEQMSALRFFGYASALMKFHPPHSHDHAMLSRLERIGIVPGEVFDPTGLPRVVVETLGVAVAEARLRLYERAKHVGWRRNGWQMNTETMGAWGTDYLKRAVMDRIGLSTNPPEDAVYPVTFVDGDGRPLDGRHAYTLRFRRHEVPPVRGFWSLTLYDDAGFPCPNALDRYAVRDRDPLLYGPDRSLEIRIQHAAPRPGLERNWLPAPAGPFNLCLRLHWAKERALDGSWTPPPVRRVA
jgi:hypothetical protein